MQATEDQKKVVDAVRKLFNTELRRSAGRQVIGLDTHYVLHPRNLRPVAEGRDPQPLLFEGAPYVMLRAAKAELRGGGELPEGTLETAARNTITRLRVTEGTYAVDVDGFRYYLLDPQLHNSELRFGFTTLKQPIAPE